MSKQNKWVSIEDFIIQNDIPHQVVELKDESSYTRKFLIDRSKISDQQYKLLEDFIRNNY